jgi:SAM-dependent methyltransferase
MSKPATHEDPMWAKWQESASSVYDNVYYETNGLVAHVNNSGHRLLEDAYGTDVEFPSVLEVGAGTGRHLHYVRHRFRTYVATDLSQPMLDIAKRQFGDRPGVTFQIADATRLDFADNTFDRLISVYNLEHLPEPHRVLDEWKRVVRPGGTVSIAIPAEGGIPWNLGRYLTTRRYMKRFGLDLDYIIAREHINACYRLVSLIRHAFSDIDQVWYPMRVPTPHLNLVYACNARVTKPLSS